MILRLLILLDCALNVLVCGGEFYFETMSSHAYRMDCERKPWGFMRHVIDTLFFWQPDHCRMSYLAVKPLLPPELQRF